MSKPAAQNIVLGAGYLHFAPFDSAGEPQGRRYMGVTPGFTVAASTERSQYYDPDAPMQERLADVVTRVDRSASITVDHVSPENLALFVIGSSSTVSQSSASVTDERHTVDQGLWYQLGEAAGDYVGAGEVSNVAVTIDPDGTATSATEGDDYTVEAETGLIYIVPGGGIADGSEIGVDYDEAQADYDQVVTGNTGPKEGLLFFRADNRNGDNRDVLIPKCTLTPNGDLAWKSRDTFMSMQFDVRVFKRDNAEQVYVNGRPA